MIKLKDAHKECEYCNYTLQKYITSEYENRGIVKFRELFQKNVCTQCMIEIPKYIGITQRKKYLDMKLEKIK